MNQNNKRCKKLAAKLQYKAYSANMRAVQKQRRYCRCCDLIENEARPIDWLEFPMFCLRIISLWRHVERSRLFFHVTR